MNFEANNYLEVSSYMSILSTYCHASPQLIYDTVLYFVLVSLVFSTSFVNGHLIPALHPSGGNRGKRIFWGIQAPQACLPQTPAGALRPLHPRFMSVA